MTVRPSEGFGEPRPVIRIPEAPQGLSGLIKESLRPATTSLPPGLQPRNPVRAPALEAVSYAGERALGCSLDFPPSLDIDGIEKYYRIQYEASPPRFKRLTEEEDFFFPEATSKRTLLMEEEADTIAYPTDEGMMMLAAYYEKKYNISIKIVSSWNGIEEALKGAEGQTSWGIIVTQGNEVGHVLPLLCHKPAEGPLQIAMLDSVNNPDQDNQPKYSSLPKRYPAYQWFHLKGDPPRQSDLYSCRTDSLCLLKDALRELQENRENSLGTILEPFGDSSFYLPPSWGKTVQISDAIRGDRSQIVAGKRGESLKSFYERYQRLTTFVQEYNEGRDPIARFSFKKVINLYLNYKGKRNLLLIRRLLLNPEIMALAASKQPLYQIR